MFLLERPTVLPGLYTENRPTSFPPLGADFLGAGNQPVCFPPLGAGHGPLTAFFLLSAQDIGLRFYLFSAPEVIFNFCNPFSS